MDLPLTAMKGIGPKRTEQLRTLGVTGVSELLTYLPRDYLDYSAATPIALLAEGDMRCVRARILSEPKIFRKAGMTVITAKAADETGEISLKWFNQPYRRNQVHAGETAYISGRVSKKKGVALLNPALSETLPGIIPVYPTVKGVPQRAIRESVLAALKACWKTIGETLPLSLLADHSLCTRQLALRHIHFPATKELLVIARRRLAFENMLCYLLAVEWEKRERRRSLGTAFDLTGIRERFLQKIPFSLTDAQLRVLDELDRDLASPSPMNRLLQGDVGSGKTVAALYALCVAAANGCQGALLAPTEILAEQHYEQAKALFGEAAVLLTGSMKKAERDAALRKLADGTALCAVGTHALLQGGVRFLKLGLVVTDEQHRFGVRQRAAMEDKGVRPDVLVMSATPIPRTLALLLYGDLDVSVIDQLPPGRKPVKTRIVPGDKREDMYRYIGAQAKLGLQTYAVCPLIGENEELDLPSVESLWKELKKLLPGTRIGILHGRMPEPDKQAAIRSFREGNTDVLVTTTVIEVGVHVENACIMVIEGADRFGLSQLHQLRGRVGRSARQAYCFLLTGQKEATERMRILTNSTDGFEIAGKDLLLRGPGDFLGARQHGEGDAALLSGALDMALLEEAKAAAEQTLSTPDDANNRLLEQAVEKYARSVDGIVMN